MPRYGYGQDTGMLEYLSKRHNRSQQMRELLSQFAMMKQLQEQRRVGEREWSFEEAKREIEKG